MIMKQKTSSVEKKNHCHSVCNILFKVSKLSLVCKLKFDYS